MENEIENLLETIGISPNETRLYLAFLETGPSSGIKITQKMGVTRQMFYFLLPSVIEKGLVKQIKVGNKNLYQAVDPEVLYDIADRTKRSLREIVPVLQTRQVDESEVPLITVYDSIISMREWYRKVLKSAKKGDEMLIWSSGKSWFNLDETFYQGYLEKKTKLGIRERVLKPDEPIFRERYHEMKRANAEWRFYEQGWESKSEKIIWRNEVSFLTIKEQSTNLIVIDSPGLAAIERFDFERIWSTSKPG